MIREKRNSVIREETAEFISQFHVYQYSFLKPEESDFSDSVVKGCKKCANYRTAWSCPPAIVSFSKCRRECLSYDEVFVFSTIYEKRNDPDGEIRREYLNEHRKITDFTSEFFRSRGFETYTLMSDRCRICDKCTFPRKACKYPERMLPCIESHGIRMGNLLGRCDMDHYFDEGYALLFTLIFIRKASAENAT